VSELVRPWRTATLIASAVAALELVLLVAAGMVLLGRSLAPHVHAAAERQALTPHPAAVVPSAEPKRYRPPQTVARISRAHTAVLVLNGNGVQGAASDAASLVRARGYLVKEVGNAPHTGYARTIVMYRPHFRAEALRFARDLNLTVVVPLDGMKLTQLHGAHLVEILGSSR
jgi:hypothetical protein